MHAKICASTGLLLIYSPGNNSEPVEFPKYLRTVYYEWICQVFASVTHLFFRRATTDEVFVVRKKHSHLDASRSHSTLVLEILWYGCRES
jgi:hypothetical protein